MKKLLFFLCLIFSLSIANAQINQTLANQLQDALDTSVSDFGNNGVSAYLIMPNGEIWDGTAGIGCQNIPITKSTLFYGASTTKMNIAILMLLLAEEGIINLDDTWSDYVSLNVAFDPSITIRQLLNHTSGIADYIDTATSYEEITSDFNHFYTPEYLLEEIVSGVPDFPAGTDWEYSNSGYVLATLVADAVTVNPVETELRTRIWNPLGMNHTYFGAYETYTEQTAGVWYDFGGGLMDYSDMPTTSMLSYAYGCGNIVTRPTDLGLLLNALINDQLLTTQSLNEMMTYVPESIDTWWTGDGYGLGIHHLPIENDDVLGHSGYYMNLTDMFNSGEHNFTLVTMTNTETDIFAIFMSMYDILINYLDVVDIENKIDLSIYPVPTTGILNIQSDTPISQIEIYNLLGQLVKSNSDQNSIDISSVDQGIYFIKVMDENENIGSQKVVKK